MVTYERIAFEKKKKERERMTMRSLFTGHFYMKHVSSLQKIYSSIYNEKFIHNTGLSHGERYLILLHFLNKLSHWMHLTSCKTILSLLIERNYTVSFTCKSLDIGLNVLCPQYNSTERHYSVRITA